MSKIPVGYSLNDCPPIKETVPLSIQQIVVLVFNVLPVPLLIGAGIGLSASEITILVAGCLLVTGIATLLQTIGVGPIGARLPIPLECSFVFVAPGIALGAQYGLAAFTGACLVGSIISWVVCCLCMRAGIGEATSYLIAAAVSSAYAEIMARIRKFPAIAYLMAALVPLIPGAGLYYTMDFISRSQMNEAWAKGSATAAIAGAVAVGVLLVSTAFRMWGVYKKKRAAAKCGTQTDSK